MRSRPTLAAGALLATAALTAAGLTGGAAHAAHPAYRSAAVARDVTPAPADVTVSGTKTSLALSVSTLTPGNTVFDVHSPGTIELVSFKSGYTIQDLFKDGKKLFSGDVKTVRRVDKKAVLWGGLAQGGEFAVNLPAGSYYVVNLNKGLEVPFTVAGTPAARVLPAAGGTVKMVQDMTFHADAKLPAQGWININNKASEPHFVDLAGTVDGTSRSTILKFLMNGAQGQPKWATGAFYDAGVVSPGHSFEWLLDAKKGEVAVLCFWPSKRTGAPHSLMGMLDVAELR